MKPTADSIFTEAMQLPPGDRAGLVDRLLMSLDDASDPAIEAAQIAECEDRLSAHRRGELASEPGESFFQSRANGKPR